MENYLVIGVSRYDFTNDAGDNITGVKVVYIGEPEMSPNKKGYFPMAITSQNLELFDKFVAVPGEYELIFRQRAGAGGKPVLVLSNVEFIQPAKLATIE